MGHRNLSVLTVEGGGLSSSHSSCLSLGFSQFVEECRSKLAGNVSEPYLSCAIATGLNRIRSKGAGAIDIEKPAQEAREGYLALVKKELKNLLPEGEADVIICGGASKLIYEELKTWLKKDQAIDSVSLAVGLTEKLVDLFRQHPDFQPEYQNSQDLAYPLRFADCFGAFNAMCMYNSKRHKSNNGAARGRQNAA
jgi:Asp/Glu/hydantoin racemase